MSRARRDHVLRIGALALALALVLELAPALFLGFVGDDFELFALARIGGFRPAALFVPHRGLFLKPVMNAAWAGFAWLFGARAASWYALGLMVHLLNAALLGLLAARLCAAWRKGEIPVPYPAPRSSWSLARGDPRDLFTGLAAAGVWAVHDRLVEPVFSLSSLNHSLTFALYLVALLTCLRALGSGAARDRLLAALAALLALFSYEVAASLIPALAVMALMDRRRPLRERAILLGAPLGLVALVYAAVQALARLAPGAASYYRLSPEILARNYAEIGLSFLHLRSDRIAPGPFPALVLAASLVLTFALVRDRLVRFGLCWSLVAYLPVAAIPEFSDRYHYIAFAGLALAAGRGIHLAMSRDPLPGPAAIPGSSMGGRPAPVWRILLAAVAAALFIVHLAWSVGGAREQAAYYGFKAKLPRMLLREARAALDHDGERDPTLLAIVWQEDPTFNARMLARFESEGMKHIFGERLHPVYVRPDAILGAVYAADLLNVSAAGRGEFYRTPDPALAARAIAEQSLRIVPVALFPGGGRSPPGFIPHLTASLREALLERRQVPVILPAAGDPPVGPLHVAYLERTDRDGAFEAEYGAARRTLAREPR